MKFKVTDMKRGKEADIGKIALCEEWAKGLMYFDMEGFAILESGELILTDVRGNFAYCPKGRFRVELEIEEDA